MKNRLFYFLMISVFFITTANAQDDDLPPTDDPDVPAAPIGDYVPVLMVIGIAFVGRIVFLEFKSSNK